MPNNNDIIENTDETDLTTPAGLVVVLSRVLYSGSVSVLLTYVLGTYVFGLSTTGIGYAANTLPTTLLWGALLFTVFLVIVAVGFRVWIMLSWGTAWVFCPSVRRMFEEFDQQNESHE